MPILTFLHQPAKKSSKYTQYAPNIIMGSSHYRKRKGKGRVGEEEREGEGERGGEVGGRGGGRERGGRRKGERGGRGKEGEGGREGGGGGNCINVRGAFILFDQEPQASGVETKKRIGGQELVLLGCSVELPPL